MKYILGLLFIFSIAISATEVKPVIKYKYKQYEKFDFEELQIEGETGSPGDLSIISRFKKRFSNKLPYRKNFNAEIRKAVERIR